MSGLLPTADINDRASVRTALCQQRTHAPQQLALLFDHFIGDSKQCGLNTETERPCRREVEDELEFRRRLHRKIAGICTFEDTIDVGRRALKYFDLVGA